MAETVLKIIKKDGDSDCARTYRYITADSTQEIPDGEYIKLKAVFKIDNTQNIERTIKDSEGNPVKITNIDDGIVLQYNFLALKAIYVGSSKPADLKVYQF